MKSYPKSQKYCEVNLVFCGKLSTCDLLCWTTSLGKSSLHWSVVHYKIMIFTTSILWNTKTPKTTKIETGPILLIRIECPYGLSGLIVHVYNYFMPVCSIVKTITPRCRGRPDALLQECNSASGRPRYQGVIV